MSTLNNRTKQEVEGLLCHGLSVGKHSQVSDAFVLGMRHECTLRDTPQTVVQASVASDVKLHHVTVVFKSVKGTLQYFDVFTDSIEDVSVGSAVCDYLVKTNNSDVEAAIALCGQVIIDGEVMYGMRLALQHIHADNFKAVEWRMAALGKGGNQILGDGSFTHALKNTK